ncbi:MAG TPA: hypothetical protein VGC42_07860 [Kofleriaceae bacterium]
MTTSIVWVAALALAACGGSGHDATVDAGTGGPQLAQVVVPVTPPTALDVLFVIDDSPSMADQQANLAAAFATFSEALQVLPGGMPDLHLGVVTTDLGTTGALDATPGPAIGTAGMGGCAANGKAGALRTGGAPITGAYLSDVAAAGGARTTNYPADKTLADMFALMAKAGDGGCGFEQPLEAMKQALLPTNAANQGFLRPSAALAVVFLTDEDDCSLAHASLIAADATALGALDSFRCTRFGVTCDTAGATPDAMNTVGAKDGCHPTSDPTYLTSATDYAAFLQGLKPDPARVAAAALMGTGTPFAVELKAVNGVPIPELAASCKYLDDLGMSHAAYPPARLAAFLGVLAKQGPTHGRAASICSQDLSSGLADASEAMVAAMGDPCFHVRLLDTDAAADGIQATCTVTADGGAAVPACSVDEPATNPPCYRIVNDGVSCGRSVELGSAKLELEGADQLTGSAHVTARCQIAP